MSNPLPDYFPRPDRKRHYYLDKNFELTMLAEQLPEGWRPRYTWKITLGKKTFNGSQVILRFFKEPDTSLTVGYTELCKDLDKQFSWEGMSDLKKQLLPLRNTMYRYNIIPSAYKPFQK